MQLCLAARSSGRVQVAGGSQDNGAALLALNRMQEKERTKTRSLEAIED